MKTNKIKLGIIMVMLVSLTMLSPTYVKGQRSDLIVIGALGPLAITPGADMQKGAELAVAEINAGAGVDVGGTAHDFDLKIATTSGTDGLPDATVASPSIADLLVTEEAVALLGGFRTEVVLGAVSPAINTSKVAFLGVGSTAPLITEYFYRVGPSNGTVLVTNLAGFYLTGMSTKGVTNIVVVREDAAWTVAVGAGVKGILGSNSILNFTIGTDVVIDQAASGTDIAAALTPLLSDTNLDAMLTLFSAPVGKAVTEQWAAIGLNENVYLAGINVEAQKSTHDIDTQSASIGEIFLETVPPGVNPTTVTAAFRAAYAAANGVNPTYTAFAAYDAVYLIKDAIERSSIVTSDDLATWRAGIHATLPSADYTGAAWQYKFTSENNWGQVKNVPDLHKYNNTIVHDLFTTSTVGKAGFPYAQPYYSQWTQDGRTLPVWGSTLVGFSPINSPPFGPDIIVTTDIIITTVDGVETTITSVGTVVETEQNTVLVTVTETDEGLPGFGLFIALSSIIFVSIYISRTGRRKD